MACMQLSLNIYFICLLLAYCVLVECLNRNCENSEKHFCECYGLKAEHYEDG
jgi:hypothetical protein